MKNQFFNIQAAEMAKVNESANNSIAELKTLKTTEEILANWRFKNLMTKGAIDKKLDLEGLTAYLTQRINKETTSKIKAIKSSVSNVTEAGRTITDISISVEWAKNRTWGMCPMADVRVCFSDNTCDNYKSGRITGCGYDKESTAVAQALNQCNELLHSMYVIKDSNIKKENRDLFGYGSGYGVKPYLEGGVGVSCYPRIFESIGYEWKGISHGKTYDVYAVNQLKK